MTKRKKIPLRNFIEENSIKITALINTHCHVDHVLGNHFVKNAFNTKLYIHEKDIPTLKSNEVVAPAYGFHNFETCEADFLIDENDRVTFGEQQLEVLFVPGHAPGHIALFHREDAILYLRRCDFSGKCWSYRSPRWRYGYLTQQHPQQDFSSWR